ncbi:outer membrane beta-barrel protein [Catenovulum sp. SM1970]|uniref:outer membrane beta-barrel protein n=1 Tax=Marinifaba aquimaris TaxID=2741323 RepID=UPI001571BA16|nr:outer membrane beta-barrel protein [Marinifaba aquimaris]NTS75961.1 outer membrane beta-barrel protein [Marinifaba aquimaris]
MSSKIPCRFILLTGLSVSCSAFSGDLKISPEISSSIYFLDKVESLDLDYEDQTAYELKPSLALTYSSYALDSKANISHNYIENSASGAESQNITEAELENKLYLLDKRVTFELGADRSFQNIDSTNPFFTDPIYGQSNFTDVDEFSTGLVFNNLNKKNWQISSSVRATKTDVDIERDELQSEQPVYSNLVNATRLQSSVILGYSSNRFYSYFNGVYTKTDKEDFSDQESQRASFNAGVPIWHGLGLAINASHEKNDANRGNIDNADISYDSWGAGLTWRFSKRSYAEVTYNQDDQSGNSEFVAYRLNWQPSNRTKLSAEYSKRFYGDAYNVDFSWQGKRIKSQLSYIEEVTSISQIIPSEESNNGYILVDRISLNKTGQFSVSFKQRRLNTEIKLSSTDREQLDNSDGQIVYSATLTSTLQVGRKNSARVSLSYSDSDYKLQNRQEETTTAEASFKRNINPQTDVSLNYRISSRDSNLQYSNFERRIWLSFNHKF